MQHLSSERLAAFADDEPTGAEAMHLAECAVCARERRAYRELLLSARRQGDRIEAPLTDWNTLSGRFIAEGLIRKPMNAAHASRGAFGRMGILAASLLLLAGAAVGGRISAGASALPGVGRGAQSEQGALAEKVPEFTSAAEALNVYLRAQRDLQRSAAYLDANEQRGSTRVEPRAAWARLAALEEVRAASIAGLRDAPTDPVLNSLYTSTLNAYQSTMRQLNELTPVGMQVRNY